MKTVWNRAGLLFIVLFYLPGIAQAVDGTVLWPSDALTKVLRSDARPAGREPTLSISAARGEIVSAQAVFRPRRDVDAA